MKTPPGDKKRPPMDDLTFYKFLIKSLPIAILTVNADFKITGFNPWCENITGFSEEEAIGRHCGEILRGDICAATCPLRDALIRENPITQIDSNLLTKGGDIVPVRMSTAAVFDDKDNLIGAVEAFQDISRMKAAEREKDNLISMFAHDMKSSISIIGGFTLRLLKTIPNLDEEKQRAYLEIIQKESGNLEFIVEDFLEFARLQTGKLKLDFEPTSLDRELMEIVDAYQESKASPSGIRLKLQSTEPLPTIEADAKRLHRVFTNLLDNALKFSKEEGEIIVTAKESGRDITIQIKDQGNGIHPKDLPYIFDAFHRGRGTKKAEGSGVGLAAVKAIVEGHGGRIDVESELGKGSVFTVVLPKSRDTDNT
ncbi:MAG: PAS domain-containing sensor histidine kinase [Deltaproteobacteria bacterium]|nr:PAS domain-containing sensor histidine kinase [Deltaproteobacteria bacterium]